MFFLIPNGQKRPSITEKVKDEKYHLDFAKYCIGQSNNYTYDQWLQKIKKNKSFYKGDQWVDKEDLDVFLKDDTDQDRNRIKLVQNVIRPMIEQYRGNAIRMNINFKVKSISQQAINRRETALAEALFYSKLANNPNNPFGEDIKKQKPVGDSEAETRAIVDNLYVDKYVEKINYLIDFVKERNNLDDKQLRIAEEMAFSGIGVIKTFPYAGHQEFKVVPSDTFFFDMSAREYDLNDALYQGELTEMGSSEIFEAFPDLDDKYRKFLENYSINFGTPEIDSSKENMNKIKTGKIPVFTVYWKDGEYIEYGYVKDEYGYDYLTKINYIEEGQDKPKYTDKDLVKNNSLRSQKLLNGQLKKKIYVDVIRTATIIPSEIFGTSANTPNEEIKDIVLDWGIAPYQETENIEYHSAKFPYKCYCWGFVDGEILSPIDDAIDPQRFINRVFSIAENQINNSRGSGTVIDGTMVDDQDEVLRNMNQSKPVFIQAKGRGIQNAIGSYDTTIKQGTMVLYNIIDSVKNSIQQTTGVNEALRGESTGSDQLVGVTQLMIQRGSLMQEPFYNAMTMVFKQCYQSIATVGKRIYADSERNLAIATGDEGVEVIKITKDMIHEDFRTFVKRENSDEMLTNAGNQMLMTLFQLGLIDEKRVSNLYGRSTPDQVASAMRSFAKEKEEISRSQGKQMQQQQQMDQQMQQQQQSDMENMAYEQQAREDVNKAEDRNAGLKKEVLKNIGKLADKSQQAKNILLEQGKNLQI